MSFPDLGLAPEFEAGLARLGIEEPSPVQRMAIPALLGGASAVVVARTGSGKTLAYGLPLVARVAALEAELGAVSTAARPRGLVLTSTRELVEQATRHLKAIAHRPRARVRALAGGMTEKDHRPVLGTAFDVLVGNPPRLRALAEAGRLDLSDVRVVVVDEADTLLSPGQRPDVEALVERCAPGRQVAWISATLPEPIRAYLVARPARPAILLAKDAHTTPTTVEVRNIRTDSAGRADAAHACLVAGGRGRRGIVFCNTREGADEAAAALRERGHALVVAHGGMLPRERAAAVRSFQRAEAPLLVTTELGGRGLDIPDLAFVLNWELPERASDYVHRAGRVGRMGAGGEVINLVTDADRRLVAEIARLAGGARLDTGEPLRAARERGERR
jgi:ATP-dependent RNA helicase DeaD